RTVPRRTRQAAPALLAGHPARSAFRLRHLPPRDAPAAAAMGFRIWIPKNDRLSVLRHWSPDEGILLETLPLNYDDVTLQTIERIDVIWLKGRAIQRAFEVEHTTAVYSGLLRMADLLALQP